jgi:hypothetical protein
VKPYSEYTFTPSRIEDLIWANPRCLRETLASYYALGVLLL